MAAEVQEWIEGGVVKSVGAGKEPLVLDRGSPVPGPSRGTTTNGSLSTEEPALSVASDNMSEEYSSDSGKGCSDSIVTPPDSISGSQEPLANDLATVEAASLSVVSGYTPYMAYSKTVGSVMPNHAMIYEFEISQHIVGRLIGRYGCFVSKIKYTTGASIIVKRHQTLERMKICAIEGACSEIEQAIKMIRERFPVKRYPQLTLEQVNSQQTIPTPNIAFIPNNRLNLIEGIVNDVCLTCVTDLDHVFIQHPSHPTYTALSRLHECMKALYKQEDSAPKLVQPFNVGVICITKVGTEDWARAEVVAIHEDKDEVTARLVDIGGYVQVPIDTLRQIRVDFVTIPFQATECRLANIAPINEAEGWSEEAINFFKILCQGHALQAHVVGYCNLTSATLINLYKLVGHSNHIYVNEEMVSHNYAKWIDELDHQYVPLTAELYANQMLELSQNMTDCVLSPDSGTGETTEETDSPSTLVDKSSLTNSASISFTTSWAEEMSETDALDYVDDSALRITEKE